MKKKENKFIVVVHDLQTLAAVLRIKPSPPREAISLKDEKNRRKNYKSKKKTCKVKNKHYLLCVVNARAT